MAGTPNFATAPIAGSSVLGSTADTSYTAPTHTVTLVTAASVTVASCVTNSTQLVTVASGGFPAVLPGFQVIGTGVAPGTTVLAILGNNLILSLVATAGGTVTLTFAPNGIKIEEIDFVGAGTTVAGVCQLFLYDGTTYHAWFSQLVTVVTPSTTLAPFFQAQYFTNLEIPYGWSLVATSWVANQLLNVVAFGAAY